MKIGFNLKIIKRSERYKVKLSRCKSPRLAQLVRTSKTPTGESTWVQVLSKQRSKWKYDIFRTGFITMMLTNSFSKKIKESIWWLFVFFTFSSSNFTTHKMHFLEFLKIYLILCKLRGCLVLFIFIFLLLF